MRKSIKKSLGADVLLPSTLSSLMKGKGKATRASTEIVRRQQQSYNKKRLVVMKKAKYLLALVEKEVGELQRFSYGGTHSGREEPGGAASVGDRPPHNCRPSEQSPSVPSPFQAPALLGVERFSEFGSHAVGAVEGRIGLAARAATDEEAKVNGRGIRHRVPRRRKACRRLDLYM